GGCADALGKSRRSRVHEDAGGFERAGRQHDYPSAGLTFRARVPVQKHDPGGLPSMVHREMADHCVAHQSEAARSESIRQRRSRTVEIGCGEASAVTLLAVMAGGSSVQRSGQVRAAIRSELPAESPGYHIARVDLAA